MNHRDMEEQITAYLLGDLEPGAADNVRDHLEVCESCRALARELEPTLDLLRGALAADVDVPEQLDADRRRTLRRRRTPAPLIWLGAYARPLAYAAAAVVFLGALALVLQPSFEPAMMRSSGALSGVDKSRMELARADTGDYKQTASGPATRTGMATFDESGAPVEEAVRYDADDLSAIAEMELGQTVATLNEDLAAEPETAREKSVSLYANMEEDGVASVEEWMSRSRNAPTGEAKAERAAPVAAGGRIVRGVELMEVSSKDRRVESDQIDRYSMLSKGTEAEEGEDIAMRVPAQSTLTREKLGREDRAWFGNAEAKSTGKAQSSEGVETMDAAGEAMDMASLALYHRGGEAGAGGVAGDTIVVADAQDHGKKKVESESIAGYGMYDVGFEMAPGETVDAVSAPRPTTVPLVARNQGAAEAAGIAVDNRMDAFIATDLGDDDGDALAAADIEYGERPPARKPAIAGAEVASAPVFRAHGVNPFVDAADALFSTFSIDVDTASYTVSRKYILSGMLPPPEAVRTEEFVNFFDYGYRAPRHGTFGIYTEAAPTPFGEGRLLKIGVKGRHLGREEQKQAVLTFVIDTSGSMDAPDRLGLVKKALSMLVEALAPTDQVAIVQVDSEARLVLEHTRASERDAIRTALDAIQCSGSTHLEAGIELGYDVAARAFVGGAANRVLLLSDGAANLGSSDADQILSRVAARRTQGITCSVFGFGIGTFNDDLLETLADKGDGTYRFIDSVDEARRVFVSDLAATLNTIARDVKIQVEFNPDMVARYRQIGYENRQLTQEQFRDDTVDAGEVGSGQSVTALYELVLRPDAAGQLGTVRVRYEDVDTGAVEEIAGGIAASSVRDDFETASVHFRLAAAVAEFAEILRGSPFAEGSVSEDVARVLRPVAMELDIDPRVQELLRLVNAAGALPQAGE